MDISFNKKDVYTYEVTARFDPRVEQQHKVRFYWQDAQERLLQEFSNIKSVIVDEPSISLVISNYREPFQGTWRFFIQASDELSYKEMADKFEEKQLKLQNESDTLKKKSSKKRKDKEIIENDS